MYLHKMIYVCVCPVGGYFIHQIFVYPNMITFFFFESYNFEQLTGAHEILYITILKSQTYILRPQVPPERGVKLL